MNTLAAPCVRQPAPGGRGLIQWRRPVFGNRRPAAAGQCTSVIRCSKVQSNCITSQFRNPQVHIYDLCMSPVQTSHVLMYLHWMILGSAQRGTCTDIDPRRRLSCTDIDDMVGTCTDIDLSHVPTSVHVTTDVSTSNIQCQYR